jgi:hypothetical protein
MLTHLVKLMRATNNTHQSAMAEDSAFPALVPPDSHRRAVAIPRFLSAVLLSQGASLRYIRANNDKFLPLFAAPD